MSTKNRPRRTYNSSRRQEQAQQTRSEIVAAARRLFMARGYSGATLEAIAREAGVAVETVYAAFGNKRAILSRLLSVSLLGDEEPVPLLQREGPLGVQRETDQRRQIELFAADMYNIMQRIAPILMVMRAAAKTDPEISQMLEDLLRDRAENLKVVPRFLMANGPLRPGLTVEEAAQTIWALTSGEVFTLLIEDLGWPADKYKSWLTDSLMRLLLP
ncbi:MAG: TetR/AcrR family transcriptional regulator [Bacteroidota bacterium]